MSQKLSLRNIRRWPRWTIIPLTLGMSGLVVVVGLLLASASDAIVVGFNVRPDRAAQDAAKEEDIEIRLYTVIYDLLDEVKQVMIGKLEPTIKETVLGQAEVRQTFKVPKIGAIAGCHVLEGVITRNSKVRLLRDNVVIYEGELAPSIKRSDAFCRTISGADLLTRL